jgi:uroporphyrinogen decarboxylase
MAIHNDLLLRAARGEQVDRVPVWVMRQAGRILPEYREVRASVSGFVELVKRPDLVAEVTLQPVDILGVDAAIIFSDILVVPEAMGLPYEMSEGRGPSFPRTIQSESDLRQLRVARADDLGYVMDGIRLTVQRLGGRVPLIGFAGAPWTIFCYMTEGRGSKEFSIARRMAYANPKLAHRLLEMIAESTTEYLKAQIRAGADIVQVFDSWAGVLPAPAYREFGLQYIRQICKAIDEVPVIVFAKGAHAALPDMASLPCSVIGLDWTVLPSEARRQCGPAKTLQGNLDPALLYADPEVIRAKTREMIGAFGNRRYIANLGHGVYPDTEAGHVKCFIDAVKEYSSLPRPVGNRKG